MGEGHLEYLGVNRRILLKCILKKQEGIAWTGYVWLSIGTRRDRSL
jgi:hypothetical protein